MALWPPPPALVGAALAAPALGIGLLARRRADARLAELAPDPAPAPTFLLAVRYLVQDCHRGRDRGVGVFLDGWLIFEGRRTRFALRSVDLRDAHLDAGDVEVALKVDRWSMLLQGGGEFERRFFAWYRAGERVEGEATLPTPTMKEQHRTRG